MATHSIDIKFLVNMATKSTEKAIGTTKVPYCIGKWLSSDQALVDGWLQKHIAEVDGLQSAVTRKSSVNDMDVPDFGIYFLPSIQSFNDATGVMPLKVALSCQCFFIRFLLIPGKQRPLIRNYYHMLCLLNHVLTKAPQFDSDGILVSIPMFAILRMPAFTTNDYAALLNFDC